MPFITEELWSVTAEQAPSAIACSRSTPWPSLEGIGDASAEAEIGWVIDLITAIRSVRAEMNVNAAAAVGYGEGRRSRLGQGPALV